MRIDKWLWCVRLFKTRSLATQACQSGKVTINDSSAKASKEIKIGDIITVNFNPLHKKVRVKDFLSSRVGAKEVERYMEDLTPEAEYEKMRMLSVMMFEKRDQHIGRPTKKDRRSIEKFKDF